MSNYLSNYSRYLYFEKRYNNFHKVIKYADIILVSHPDIFKNYKTDYKNIFYVMPKLNKFKKNKKVNLSNTFKFSGELNIFRKNFFLKFKDYFNLKKLEGSNVIKIFVDKIEKFDDNTFIDIPNKKKFKFSFHPKKDPYWNFSSPIRYVDAIRNGEIPIIFDKFNDFFAKNLSIYINIKSLKSEDILSDKFYYKNIKIIQRGVTRYNKFIINNNNLLKAKIKNLFTK